MKKNITTFLRTHSSQAVKKMKLNHSLETLESELHNHETLPDKRQNEGFPDSPESPDESMSSDVFLVEEATNEENSISSSRVAEYLEQIQHEDRSSYLVLRGR